MSEAADAEADSTAAAEQADPSADGDEERSGFWPSLKRNDVSGLPGKKPYQRKDRD